MEQKMQTVVVLARLAGQAKDSGKLPEFIGYLIGAFAECNTALLEHNEEKACSILGHLADVILADCGELRSAGQTVQ